MQLKLPSSRQFHFWMIWVWTLLAIPSVLWWHSSILWVIIVSVYANVVGHWGAYQASRGEEMADPNIPT